MSDANRWLDEVYQGVVRTGFRLKKRIFKAKSPFQTVEVVETVGHGKLLLIDGMTMVSERDEFVYHEMIAHVPLFLHPRPRRVLVIGGGDGGSVREVLRHKTVELCVLVEIDGLVVDAAKRFIPKTASALSSRRALVRIEDGVKFVRETSERFDVIIVDSTEPFGPAKELFGTTFYKDVRRILTERGIVVSQAGSPFYELGTIKNLTKILKTVFPVTDAYTFTNLTYPGGLWAFAYASKGVHPVRHFNSARVKSARLPLQWYNEEIHVGAFALPEFLRKAVGR
ncbi:MAG: spermidine synthase [Elusimicrobia bacterium RIFOXYD12_FULL_66_9]|nr:MAG: spermidine synthase [Elusimicrobia bacterium RIFOXYD12_FULL_66_9]